MMQFEGKVNKGIRDYWNIMTQANLESLRGKIVKVTVEEIKPQEATK